MVRRSDYFLLSNDLPSDYRVYACHLRDCEGLAWDRDIFCVLVMCKARFPYYVRDFIRGNGLSIYNRISIVTG